MPETTEQKDFTHHFERLLMHLAVKFDMEGIDLLNNALDDLNEFLRILKRKMEDKNG